MRRSVLLLGAMALIPFLGVGPVQAQEESVTPDKIPKAVMDALHARFPQAKIATCTRAKEGADVVYDIEFTQSARKGEADITEKGVYINFEQAIELKDLPKAVRAAVERRYPKSTVKEVMRETEVNGKVERLAAFEIVLVTADKKDAEVKVAPDGKILEDSGASGAAPTSSS